MDAVASLSRLVQKAASPSRSYHGGRWGLDTTWHKQAGISRGYQPLGVPDKYLDLIWTALQTVPNKQELDRELAGALADHPTEEEFRWVIKDQKKSTTPGMSNVTYGNIKDWPEELITHCYHILRVLWG